MRHDRLFTSLGLAGALLIGMSSTCLFAGDGPEGPAGASAAAIQRWQGMRFGMFIHWGPVSLKGTEIGWSRGGPRRGRTDGRTGNIPIEEYDNLFKAFNPVKFDAEQWVQIAKDAGMRYMVFTAKHHDGFCNFDSKETNYKITNPVSPYGKDICAQLAGACHKDGLALGWYYSPRDWHHPDFATKNHGRYLDFYMGQLRELCTNYGKVDILWFDGLDSPRELWGDIPQQSVKMLRSLQPGIILNNRGGLPCDCDTPEQRVGGFNRQRPWETCMTICRQWAWKPNDRMKTLEECLQTLLRTVGGDGNLLFNVGPMPNGQIEPRQVARLREMGQWLKKNGQGVYGTRGGPFKPGRWGASTCKGSTVFLYVMDWPEEGPLVLPAFGASITASRLPAGGTVAVNQSDVDVQVDVAVADRQPIVTVIELTVDGDAEKIKPVNVIYRSQSVAFGCKARASNVYRKMKQYGPRMALDDDPQTRWATDAGTDAVTLEVDLGTSTEIGQVIIDEPAEYQRVREFELQYMDGSDWITFCSGTTIGPRFQTEFDPIVAQRVRLNILQATDGPTLWEFQLLASEKGALGATKRNDAKSEEGFQPIFDGESLQGWIGLNDDTSSYYAKDGMLICKTTGKTHIFTQTEYSDFVLRLQIKMDPGGNNGIGIRTKVDGEPHLNGMEVQVLEDDYYADGDPITLLNYQHHGSIYGVVPAKTGFLKPAGEWNEEEISCIGRHLTVTLNGNVIVAADLDAVEPLDHKDHPGLKFKKGHISLHAHGNYGAEVFFRNLRVKEVK